MYSVHVQYMYFTCAQLARSFRIIVMGKLPGWFSSLRRPPCIVSMSSVEYITRARSTHLRVIFCLLTLFTCISFAECLGISSGRVVSPSRSDTGTGKASAQDAELVSREDQQKRRTGTHQLNKTGSLQDIPAADEGLPAAQKEGTGAIGRYAPGRKRSSSRFRVVQPRTAKPKLTAESDGDDTKTWEQLWNEQAPPPSVPTSGEIDADDYYTYDYFDDAEDDEEEEQEGDEDSKGLSVDRSKKDTSSTESKSLSLDRLAELVTGANPQMGPVNLGTPNPDIEITIEILNGDDARHEDVVISMDLRGGVVGTPAAPASRRPDGAADRDNGLIPPVPTGKAGEGSVKPEGGEPDLGGPDDADQDGSYSFEFVTLRRLPDPDGFNFEPDDPEETIGTWTQWSACSASCGGGRSERSRSCGFSCMATESKDCNQQACPRRGKSEPRPDSVNVDRSPPPSVDPGYLETVLDPDNFDTDSCEEWMGCRSETLLSYLSRLQDLPNCPCFYPSNLHRNNAIWDRQKRRMFRWVDSSGEAARLDVYKPTAAHCITSLLSPHSTSLAAQQCCYDGNQRLITRGPGAGTPQLISAEISAELHYKIDTMPWIICKGDWTKYNKVRHPNNMRECRELPDQAEFYRLFQEAKNF